MESNLRDPTSTTQASECSDFNENVGMYRLKETKKFDREKSKGKSSSQVFPGSSRGDRSSQSMSSSPLTFNVFYSPERMSIVTLKSIPTFWTKEDILNVLARFGYIEDHEELKVGRQKKRAFLVKYSSPVAALNAIISLATRGVGFNGKTLEIGYPDDRLNSHRVLQGTDTLECEEMRAVLIRTLDPMFSRSAFFGISHVGLQSRSIYGPMSRIFLAYVYPAFVSSILLFTIYVTANQGIRALLLEDIGSAVLFITVCAFYAVAAGIHLHHCYELSRSFSSSGLVALIQITINSEANFRHISGTIRKASSLSIPSVAFTSICTASALLALWPNRTAEAYEMVIVALGFFYSFGSANNCLLRMTIYSRIVESGLRSKTRDLLTGKAPLDEVKKQYILTSVLVEKAFSREQRMFVLMTVAKMFSTFFIAANIFLFSSRITDSKSLPQALLGIVFNLINQVWWFSTLYEGTRATEAFKDCLSNIRGPMYVASREEGQGSDKMSKHFDLDSYVSGIKIFGFLLDTQLLVLAVRLNVSLIALVFIRVFLY